MADKTICGKTHDEIRRAFFDNQLDGLLNDIQAQQELIEEDAKELEAYLELLQVEKNETRNKLAKKYNVSSNEESKPPTVDELVGVVDQEKVKEWAEKTSKNVLRVREIIALVSAKAKTNGLARDAMENLLLEIESLRSSVDQDRVYKDQLYHQRIIEIIDEHGMSRRESEDRAKITKEYRDYKLAILFGDNFSNFATALRKKMSNNY